MPADISSDFLATAIKRLLYYKDLGDKTFHQLDEADFHFSPGHDSNSIAVIVQHLAGNMLSRWTNFLTEDGEKEWRARDSEFEKQQLSKQALIDQWEKGWQCFIGTLQSLTAGDLGKQVSIRKEPLTVVDAINRQLAHYPYHIGQIVYLGRMIKGIKWQNLSIPKGGSDQYNKAEGLKDPANK